MRNANGYRSALENKRAEVLSMLGHQIDALQLTGPVAEDDQAQWSHLEFISTRVNVLEHDVLRQVDEALGRMRSGEYGVCQHCGESIAQRRLDALPWARYCVQCQEQLSAVPV